MSQKDEEKKLLEPPKLIFYDNKDIRVKKEEKTER